jgi:hypothetical protein
MFCTNCGKELNGKWKICPYCGSEVKQDAPGGEQSAGPGLSGTNAAPGNAAPGNAAPGNAAPGGASPIHDPKQLLTQHNFELMAVIGAFMGIPLSILRRIFRGYVPVPYSYRRIGGVAGFLSNFSRVSGFLRGFVTVLAVVLCVLALVSVVMLIVKYEEKGSAVYAALAADACSLLGCIGIIRHNLLWLFVLPAVVAGADLVSRVLIRKAGLGGSLDMQQDFAAYGPFFQKTKRASEQENRNQAGAQQGSAGAGYNNGSAAAPGAGYAQQAYASYGNNGFSYFDGEGITLLGYNLLAGLVGSVTCGIAMPWMICMIARWRLEHTVINGRRLKFTGTGGAMFGLWIKWCLLSIITCGIYAAWAYTDYKRFEKKHTFYADSAAGEGAVCDASLFDGAGIEYLGYSLLLSLVGSVTCQIANPWIMAMIGKWEASHTAIEGDRLDFDGDAAQFFGSYILILLLTAVTCGIYGAWGQVKINRWLVGHTYVAGRNQPYMQNQAPAQGSVQ